MCCWLVTITFISKTLHSALYNIVCHANIFIPVGSSSAAGDHGLGNIVHWPHLVAASLPPSFWSTAPSATWWTPIYWIWQSGCQCAGWVCIGGGASDIHNSRDAWRRSIHGGAKLMPASKFETHWGWALLLLWSIFFCSQDCFKIS